MRPRFSLSCSHKCSPIRSELSYAIILGSFGLHVLCWSCRHPSPTGKPRAKGDLAKHVGIELLSFGGWLTHGDAITETRLILARSRR